MKSNYKKRYNDYQSSLQGKKMDHFINLGVMLAFCALHEKLGVGRKRLDKIYQNILRRIEKDFKDGASKFTYEYSINVEIGEEKLKREYEQIMTQGDKTRERRKQCGKQKKL